MFGIGPIELIVLGLFCAGLVIVPIVAAVLLVARPWQGPGVEEGPADVCNGCGQPLPTAATNCPHCGAARR